MDPPVSATIHRPGPGDRPGRATLLGTRALVVLILAAALVQLALEVRRYGRDSLQMDFAAFYAAGEAASRGLSPYVNYIDADPPIWDGVAAYRHSRFLYPPLVADLFRPLAALPYTAAKRLWMAIALGALAAALWLAWRAARRRSAALGATGALAFAALAAAWFPLRALLERGQIDSVTLLLLMTALTLVRRRPWAAGAAIAAATLLKLHCAFALPFVLLAQRRRVAGGFVVGSVALLAIGLFVDGPAAWRDYATTQLPRIARHGEGGRRADLLPPRSFAPLLRGAPEGTTVMDGRRYAPSTLEFTLNASLVRTPLGRGIYEGMRGLGLRPAPAQVGVVLLAIALVAVAVAGRLRGAPPDDLAAAIVLVLILLCAPVTWAMGTVWLLPAAPAAIAACSRADGEGTLRRPGILGSGALVAVGLLLAAAPVRAFALEYVVAELVCLAGLCGLWLLASRDRLRDRRRLG